MATLEELKKIRLQKLEALKKAGINPYPAKVSRTYLINEVLDNFEKLFSEKKEVFLVGRIRSLRTHGGSTFVHIEDSSGRIQVYFKKDVLGQDRYNLFIENFDIGDFIETSGILFETKKGEKTLEVRNYKLLAKSLRPLPEEWYGFKDIEERYRKRYLDLLMNPEIKKRFEMRGSIIKSIREFLDKEGFIEVETPILQSVPGGALARPFKTYLNALDLDLYLRVAPELYHKMLLVGGIEKVYEIGRCFRNEGMDREHNPDFTELEFYWAYADYEDLMIFTEKLFEFLVPSLNIEYQGQKIDFMPPWKRISMRDLIFENVGFDIDKSNKKDLEMVLTKYNVEIEKSAPSCKMIDELYKKTCRPHLIQPTFVIDHPIEMSPLAKTKQDESNKAARFQMIVAGIELVNAYTELNDPIEQSQRMMQQEKQRVIGEEDIQRYDQNFIEALEYAMPPAAGFGLGIDRLVAILTNSPNLREVILFPVMRSKDTE